MQKLHRTDAFDALIIIPTVAKSDVLLPSFERLLKHLDGYRCHIVVAVNPLDEAQAEASIAGIRYLWKRLAEDGNALTIYRHPGPCGFGGAINRGLRAAVVSCDDIQTDEALRTTYLLANHEEPDDIGTVIGLPPLIVIWNDDLHVTDGWLKGMTHALTSDTVRVLSEVPNEDGHRPTRRMSDYGLPGMVGPMTNVAAGIQVISPENRERFERMGLDDFSAWWREENTHDGDAVVYTATFLSGYCQGYTPELVEALVFDDNEGRMCLFDERYKVAGYEDNDLCVRAELAGFRAVVAYDTFIGHLGHQTFDESFPDMQRGMRNRLTYYDKWRSFTRPEGEQKLVAVFRVRLDVPNDVNLFRMAMAGIGRLVDGIAILLTGPLSAMCSHPEYQQAQAAGQLPGDVVVLTGYHESQEVRGLRSWAKEWSRKMPDTRRPKVTVQRWVGDFNERDERNAVLAMGEAMGADWIISVDHDETIEPRVNRSHLERLMRHPDPMVQEWDFSWINHWANNRWQNITRPWGDGGTFLGGMHGFRMYRVNKVCPGRIIAGGDNGLHCGNVPMVGPTAKRVAGIRFRHFGYMRVQDRRRKLDRYTVQDPTPNPILVGGANYTHITHEENQLMSAFAPVNGIGAHCLMYESESAGDLGRQLDQLYGLADRIVVVWTGEWDEDDRRCLFGDPTLTHADNRHGTLKPLGPLLEVDDWPSTGPSREVACMAEHFSVEWIHHPLADHIGEARNAAIDALHGTPGMGWGFFFDPDEHAAINQEVALRRMAEVTDAWGWLFRFRNTYEDGRYNVSESVRMHRLDEGGRMRMSGRVHESFQRATAGLVEDGYGQVIRVAPDEITTVNQGLSGEPEAIQNKLDRYKHLVELDLTDNPNNPGAWVTLGLYWSNEGFRTVAMECFARGMMLATGEFLPFQEAGLEYLRLARNCYAECASRMGNHSNRNVAEAVIEFLDQAAPALPILGLPGRQPMSELEALESLPAMPVHSIQYEAKIELSEDGTVLKGTIR